MKVKSIKIIFIDEEDTSKADIVADFENGKWEFSAPIYSRIANMTHEIWKIIKEQVKD